MENFFRSLKTEWVPNVGYHVFVEEKHNGKDKYIMVISYQ